MRAGIGLTDANRLSWLQQLRNLLVTWHNEGVSGVLACSALKQKYRHLLNSGLSYDNQVDVNQNELFESGENLGLEFVLLNVERETIEQRLKARLNHDIIHDISILDSQFQTLEMPAKESRLMSDENDPNGTYLCKERSNLNGTSYLIYVLKCSSDSTVKQNAYRIVQFLPSFSNFSSKWCTKKLQIKIKKRNFSKFIYFFINRTDIWLRQKILCNYPLEHDNVNVI